MPVSRKQRRRVMDDEEIEEGSSQPNGDHASVSRHASTSGKKGAFASSSRRHARPDRDDDVEDVDAEEEEEEEGDAAVQQEIVRGAS